RGGCLGGRGGWGPAPGHAAGDGRPRRGTIGGLLPAGSGSGSASRAAGRERERPEGGHCQQAGHDGGVLGRAVHGGGPWARGRALSTRGNQVWEVRWEVCGKADGPSDTTCQVADGRPKRPYTTVEPTEPDARPQSSPPHRYRIATAVSPARRPDRSSSTAIHPPGTLWRVATMAATLKLLPRAGTGASRVHRTIWGDAP